MKRLASAQNYSHSTLFSASFLQGAVETNVLADPGADANMMPPTLLEMILKANPTLSIKKLSEPLKFSLAVNTSEKQSENRITCSREVTADVNLRIRHGTELVMRGMVWVVSDNDADCALIGRPVLEALGINTRQLLEAASDQNNGIIDVKKILQNHEQKSENANNPTSLASLLRDGVFHRDGGTESDFLEESNVYINIGEDSAEDLEIGLNKCIDVAKHNDLSANGVEKLTKMVKEDFRNVFRLRLGMSSPAKVPPMRIRVQADAVPIKVKARRYGANQRKFLKAYIDEMVQMGFLVPNKNVEWQCAPLL
eukprot:IDg22868t1